MFSQSQDINQYLGRIGFSGKAGVCLDTLCRIHELHAETIPFENISPFIGKEVLLDFASVQNKLVNDKRGGYCFEQNILLGGMLKKIGFQVMGLAARVRWNAPVNKITRRSHMLLLIHLNGKRYIADVGFGGMTLTGPLLLDTEEVQDTPHEPYRLVKIGQEYQLEAKMVGGWKPLYTFDLQRQYLPDYETMNWYMSTYPEGHFVTDLSVVRPDNGCRYALYNNRLSIHPVNGTSEKKWFHDSDAVLEVLNRVFCIEMSGDLQRLLKEQMEQKMNFQNGVYV